MGPHRTFSSLASIDAHRRDGLLCGFLARPFDDVVPRAEWATRMAVPGASPPRCTLQPASSHAMSTMPAAVPAPAPAER